MISIYLIQFLCYKIIIFLYNLNSKQLVCNFIILYYQNFKEKLNCLYVLFENIKMAREFLTKVMIFRGLTYRYQVLFVQCSMLVGTTLFLKKYTAFH